MAGVKCENTEDLKVRYDCCSSCGKLALIGGDLELTSVMLFLFFLTLAQQEEGKSH